VKEGAGRCKPRQPAMATLSHVDGAMSTSATSAAARLDVSCLDVSRLDISCLDVSHVDVSCIDGSHVDKLRVSRPRQPSPAASSVRFPLPFLFSVAQKM